mmetsp:Transcript_133761/g.266889  ORF Transcript_133761/g.266889 Transcript_133761/m.266889 type:complete len:245 (-) Transcript_133761:297-1031(-)
MGISYSRKYDPRELPFKVPMARTVSACSVGGSTLVFTDPFSGVTAMSSCCGMGKCHEAFDDVAPLTCFVAAATPSSKVPASGPAVEAILQELFSLHDLNSNGLLEEEELVLLKVQVAKLHYGEGVDIMEVETKYRALFRDQLDEDGLPVGYAVFREYMIEVLDDLDRDPRAQEMIAEQLTVEARVARIVLEMPSATGVPSGSLRPGNAQNPHWLQSPDAEPPVRPKLARLAHPGSKTRAARGGA